MGALDLDAGAGFGLCDPHGFQSWAGAGSDRLTIRSTPSPTRSAFCRARNPWRQLGSHCPATAARPDRSAPVTATAARASSSEKPASLSYRRFIAAAPSVAV
jgi:hypothetical protein